MLEKKCFKADFQDVPAKLHLFNTLVRPAALYEALMWGMDMTAKEWGHIERLQIYFLSKMIMSKASVPHPIILAEFSATPLQLDAAFQLVSFLHKVHQLGSSQQGQCRLPWIALKSSKDLAEKGVQECWYAKASQWAASLGFGLGNLPPFQHNMAAANTAVKPRAKKRLEKDKNQLIRHDLEILYISKTWLTPSDLPTKMQFYKDHFLEFNEDGFIGRPGYLNIHLAHKVRHAIGQLRVSSHQLEIEAGRASRPKVERSKRICRLCHLNVIESEEHFIFTCPVYYEIRGRFHCLFWEPTSLSKLIAYEDQKCIALFLHQMTVHRRNLLKEQAGGRVGHENDPTQRLITLFLIGGDNDNKRKAGSPPDHLIQSQKE